MRIEAWHRFRPSPGCHAFLHPIALCDRLGGIDAPAAADYIRDFRLNHATRVNESLDPFSDAYFNEQLTLYREIAGRDLDQETGELTTVDVERNWLAANPYGSRDIGFIARHARAIHSVLVTAGLPPGAKVLDMGAGWGLSSEAVAFAGACVTAVDINPAFVELVNRRAARLSLSISAVHGTFDGFETDDRFDLILFYECLHHALRPWRSLRHLGRFLAPGGKIAVAGEPINNEWRHWGLRRDPLSVYCIRKFGWFESGWTAAFLVESFREAGFRLTLLHGIGLDNGTVGIALREDEQARINTCLVIGRSSSDTAQCADLNEMRAQRDALLASTSWRLTAPLRALRRLF